MTIKTQETTQDRINKLNTELSNFDGADYRIEITNIEDTEKGINVFARVWAEVDISVIGVDEQKRIIEAGSQIGFGVDGTVDIERFRLHNPEGWDNIENPTLDIVQTLFHTIQVKKEKFGSDNIIAGKIGNTTTTVYPNSGTGTAPIDGLLRKQGMSAAFSTCRAETTGDAYASETTSTVARQIAHTVTDQFSRFDRGSFGFDTSSIPDGDTISSATFSLYVNTKDNGLGEVGISLVSHTPASESALVSADFNTTTFGTTALATNLDTSAISTGQYNDWTLNASGIAHIDKTGNTIFGVISEWDRADSFGGTWVSGAKSGLDSVNHADNASNKPKLVVEHSSAGPVTVVATTQSAASSIPAPTIVTGTTVSIGGSQDIAASAVTASVTTTQSVTFVATEAVLASSAVGASVSTGGNVNIAANTQVLASSIPTYTVTAVAPSTDVTIEVTTQVMSISTISRIQEGLLWNRIARTV